MLKVLRQPTVSSSYATKSYEGRINSAIKSHVTRIVTDHNNVGARIPIVSLLRTFILFVIFYALVWICTDTWKDYILDTTFICVLDFIFTDVQEKQNVLKR